MYSMTQHDTPHPLKSGAGMWPGALPLVSLLFLLVLVAVAYAPGLRNLPVAEDFIAPGQFLILSPEHRFRPGFALPMMAVASRFGAPEVAPQPYHLVTLLAHLLTTAGLFLLVRRLAGDAAALVAALVFGLAPRAHEAIVWPAAGAHTLMTMWFVFCVFAYVQARGRPAPRHGRLWMAIALLCYTLALLTCESALIGLALLGAWEWLWGSRPVGSRWPGWRPALNGLWPFGAAALIYLLVVLAGIGGPSQVIAAEQSTAGYNLHLGLSKLKDWGGLVSYTVFGFVPLRAVQGGMEKALFLAAAAAVLLATSLAGGRLGRFGVVWVVLSVLPYVIFVPFGSADRYTYLATVGMAMAVAGLLTALFRWWAPAGDGPAVRRTRVVEGALAVLILLYVVGAVWSIERRVADWREAGRHVAGLLATLYAAQPVVDEPVTDYLLGLPKRAGDAWVLGVGASNALCRHHAGGPLQVAESDDPGLLESVRAAPDAPPQVGTRIFVYEQGRLVDRSGAARDPAVARLLSSLEPTSCSTLNGAG
jgi:hypothetical protein